MIARSDIHELIRSMDNNEKRHFKINASAFTSGKVNNYVKLFDSIEKQKTYNELTVRKQLAHEKFSAHFAVHKNYLHQLILKDLQSFHYGNTVASKLYNNLVQIEILYQKNLIQQAERLVKKGKELAMESERFIQLLSYLKWEMFFSIREGNHQRLSDVKNQIQKTVKVIELQESLYFHSIDIKSKMDRTGFRSLKEVASVELMLEKIYTPGNQKKYNSFMSVYAFHTSRAMLAFLRNRHDVRYAHFEIIMDTLDANVKFREQNLQIYQANISNLIKCCIVLGIFEQGLKLIEKEVSVLLNRKNTDESLQKTSFLSTEVARLNIYYRMGETATALHKIQEIIRKEKQLKLDETTLHELHFWIAVNYFVAKDFRGASRWLNKIINRGSNIKANLYLEIFSRLLMLHVLALNKDPLFISRYHSYARYFAKNNEYKSVQCICDAAFHYYFSERKNSSDLLKEALNQLKELTKVDEESIFVNIFDFQLLLTSEVKKTDLAQLLKNKSFHSK